MEFSIISTMFEKMEKTAKRTELTSILVELLKKTPKKIIPNVVYLLQGIIRPNFEGVELGVAEKLAIRAISKSSGLSIKIIEDDYRYCGNLGLTASNILKLKTQTTFTTEKITVERVYETLFNIAIFLIKLGIGSLVRLKVGFMKKRINILFDRYEIYSIFLQLKFVSVSLKIYLLVI